MEQRLTLVTAGYAQHRSQGLTCQNFKPSGNTPLLIVVAAVTLTLKWQRTLSLEISAYESHNSTASLGTNVIIEN